MFNFVITNAPMQMHHLHEETPLWKQEVEWSPRHFYQVIPEAPVYLLDPYKAPRLRKWLVLNTVAFHLQMGATPVLLIPMVLPV